MFIKIFKDICQKKSLVRSLMNINLSQYELSGKVLDVGGARASEYSNIFRGHGNYELTNTDLKSSEEKMRLNFETDKLPFLDDNFDSVIILNLLEHLFNYDLLVGEIYRVLKNGGNVIGFVPFLINVHPDPHDYFRYTEESLRKIFIGVGFADIVIKEVGRGPFAVNFNNIVLSIPLWTRLILFPVYYFLDFIFMIFRPTITKRFPLGYIFLLKK